MNAGIIFLLVVVLIAPALWWWFVARNRPSFPPLAIDDDDPAMLAAIDKARATLTRFVELLASGSGEAQVKIQFRTSSGETEHLWAEVLEISEPNISVRYLTPPVSHTGKLERIHQHAISEIEDWAVFMPTGEIHGGYTQRVMFDRARQVWGDLPSELEAQEAKYVG